jgi:hypothetical protein
MRSLDRRCLKAVHKSAKERELALSHEMDEIWLFGVLTVPGKKCKKNPFRDDNQGKARKVRRSLAQGQPKYRKDKELSSEMCFVLSCTKVLKQAENTQ